MDKSRKKTYEKRYVLVKAVKSNDNDKYDTIRSSKWYRVKDKKINIKRDLNIIII